jgi:hypothetical protein
MIFEYSNLGKTKSVSSHSISTSRERKESQSNNIPTTLNRRFEL